MFQERSMSELSFEKQKSQILKAAEAVVHHFGFAKTTMQDIAEALSRGKSFLYHYFASKEEIFVELLHKEIADLQGEFLRAVEAEDTPEGKIRAYVLTRTRMFRDKLRAHMSFVEETLERFELLMRIHEAYDAEEVRIIESILSTGVAEGVFAIDDPAATAVAIVHVLKGFELPFIQGTGDREIEKKLDSTLWILFNGILARRDREAHA
jgi:AcrR family transcriptional regulator